MMKDGSADVVAETEKITAELKDAGVRVKLDARDDQRPGWKFTQYEIEGVPVRLALGPRDLAAGNVEVARRDTGEKNIVPREGIVDHVKTLLADIQKNLFQKALEFRKAHTTRVDTYDEFKEVLDSNGGFIMAHWDGSDETETRIKEETKATIRCIPLVRESEEGVDMLTGKPSKGRVVFGRAY
jgi:prolyl-tRNA synthetase